MFDKFESWERTEKDRDQWKIREGEERWWNDQKEEGSEREGKAERDGGRESVRKGRKRRGEERDK